MIVVVASASLARPVMPTAVPTVAFSATVLAAALVSRDRADVEFVDVVDGDRERLVGERAVGRGGADRDVVAGRRFAVDRAGHGDDARVGVDGKTAAGVVVQGVGDRVVRGIRVAGRGVMPTAVPLAAFSFTALAAALVSLTAPTSNSFTSVTLMVNVCVGERAVGRRGPDRDVVSWRPFRGSALPSATVTTPVVASIANRPPALSSSV